jgi:hypothetical protein
VELMAHRCDVEGCTGKVRRKNMRGAYVHKNFFVLRRTDGAETVFSTVQEAFAARATGDTVWIKPDVGGYFGPVLRP